MTLASTTNEWEYPANGVTTAFAYTAKVQAASHLVVTVVASDGTRSTKILNTDYTVSGVGRTTGGNVTFTSAPANLSTVVIERTLPLTQLTDIKNQGDFYPETHENLFDRLVMIAQQVTRSVGRAIVRPAGSDDYDANGNKIVDLADGEDATDAATKGQLDDAVTAMAAAMAAGTAVSYATDTGDGAEVNLSFPGITVSSAGAYIVAVGGVIQQPNTDYTVDVASERIEFSTAPGNGVAILAISLGYKRAIDEADSADITFTPSGTGAVARTVQAKLREVSVSVKDFGATGNGSTDDSAAIQAAIDAVYTAGGGVVFFPRGTYLIQSALYAKTGVHWFGESAAPSYLANATSPTVIKRHTSLAVMVYQSGSRNSINFIEFEGNSGQTSATATYGIAKPTTGAGSGIRIISCTFSNLWYGLGNSANLGAVHVESCVFRNNKTGAWNTSDSRYIGNTFTGNYSAAMNLNTGGVHITGNLFEFNRTGAGLDESAFGIFIQSNANELQIDNNRFDRNAGQDIYITSGRKRPRDISINHNHFMRSAWGTNTTNRASIYISNADRVSITDNIFYAANANPSTARGLVCPRVAVAHSGCVGLIYKGNNDSNLAREINLVSSVGGAGNSQNMAPVWTESASGTDEWYLTDWWDNTGRTIIEENAPAILASNVLTLLLPTSHGILAGDSLYLSGDVGVSFTDGAKTVASVATSNVSGFDLVTFSITGSNAGTTLLVNNATAAIVSNVLTLTIADSVDVSPSQKIYLADGSSIGLTTGIYEITSVVASATAGYNDITILVTAADDTGTCDLYNISGSTDVSTVTGTPPPAGIGGNAWLGKPTSVVVNGVMLTEGTVGSLAAGEWGWDDNDTLSFDTLYVRTTETGEPGLQTITAYHDLDPFTSQLNNSAYSTRSTDIQTDYYKDAVRYAPAARVSIGTGSTASITSKVLTVTVVGHTVVAGDYCYLSGAVTVAVNAGVYLVDSISGDDIIFDLTGTYSDDGSLPDAVGTVNIATVTPNTFVLKNRRRGMTNHVLPLTIRFSCDQATTTSKALAEFPCFVVRGATTALPTISRGTINAPISALSVNWYATSSDNNLSVSVSSDPMGDDITVMVWNSTAYSIEYTAELLW